MLVYINGSHNGWGDMIPAIRKIAGVIEIVPLDDTNFEWSALAEIESADVIPLIKQTRTNTGNVDGVSVR
jgi:hypothetical protein